MAQNSLDALAPVSVVIPCRNGEATLDEQLRALANQDYEGPLEIIVADNASSDGSKQVASRWPDVKVVSAFDRRGPNHARNVGAHAATGELVLTCDADDVVSPEWVAAMERALREFDLVGGSLDYTLLNDDSQRWPQARDRLSDKFGFLPAAIGASFGVRRTVLEALGGWDESFEGGPDDTELCWRAQLAGYDLGSAPDAIVHYRLRNTTPALARQAYNGGRRIPLLARRFRSSGMPIRGLVAKAARFSAYIVFAAPGALVSKRIRMEWVRRLSLAAGFARGLAEKHPASQTLGRS